MKRLVFLAFISSSILSCTEDENNDLSGRYNFIEPPHPISRLNRLDNSQVAFDVIFTINGNDLTEIDMVLGGIEIEGESGSFSSGNDLSFEGGEGRIELFGIRKSGNTLQVSRAEFRSNGLKKTYGPLQIDRY